MAGMERRIGGLGIVVNSPGPRISACARLTRADAWGIARYIPRGFARADCAMRAARASRDSRQSV